MIFLPLRLNMKASIITSSHRSITATTQRKLPFDNTHHLHKCSPHPIRPGPTSVDATWSYFQWVCMSTKGSYSLLWDRTEHRNAFMRQNFLFNPRCLLVESLDALLTCDCYDVSKDLSSHIYLLTHYTSLPCPTDSEKERYSYGEEPLV